MTKRKRPTRTTASFSPLTTAQHRMIAAAAPQKRGKTITSIVAEVDRSAGNTCVAIPDSQNVSVSNREAVQQPLEYVRVNGDSRGLAELLPTARVLHTSGQMSDAALSHLVLLANT